MTDRPLAVIVAMDAELTHLVSDRGRRGPDLAGRPRYDLTVGGHPVVAVRSGMGMLNAAAATERVVAEFAPAAILNYGCAGAHRRDVLPGDVVIGDRVIHHGAYQLLPGGEERHTGFGYEAAGEPMHAAELPADPAWLAAALTTAAGWTVQPWPPEQVWPAGIPRRAAAIHRGPVASADVWTQDVRRLDVLHGRHGSLCEDMEAAAIAHVAALHGLPSLSIKDISNSEFHALSDLDGFSDFPTAEVGRRASALLLATIETWASTTSASTRNP